MEGSASDLDLAETTKRYHEPEQGGIRCHCVESEETKPLQRVVVSHGLMRPHDRELIPFWYVGPC